MCTRDLYEEKKNGGVAVLRRSGAFDAGSKVFLLLGVCRVQILLGRMRREKADAQSKNAVLQERLRQVRRGARDRRRVACHCLSSSLSSFYKHTPQGGRQSDLSFLRLPTSAKASMDQ